MGFKLNASYPCIFVNRTDLIVLYLDDCIILYKSKAEADKILSDLNNKCFKMTGEGTKEEYLGIWFSHYDGKPSGCHSHI